MTDEHQQGSLSLGTVALFCMLAGLIAFVAALGGLGTLLQAGGWKLLSLTGMLLLNELALVALILVAAGGYGNLLVRQIAPADSPAPLRVASGCVVGLWMLSTVMLLVGTLGHGLLRAWVWWPVLGLGAALGFYQARGIYNRLRAPRMLDGRALLWVVVAIAAGLWLAGVVRQPGLSYDAASLEFHLQVPREFYQAGQITVLPHNVYSHLPLGSQMLSLLAMCLRGGAYEGMYLAKLLHGAWWALAIAAVFGSLRKDDDWRGRFATALMATAPATLFFGWLAGAELAGMCCTVLALLWLRQWLRGSSVRSAWLVGMMLGVALTVGYEWLASAAVPILVVMLIATVRQARRGPQFVLACGAMLVLASPWLIRTAAYTGNPVFPYATETLGKGTWSDEQVQRWDSAHAATVKAPVPQPAGWQKPDAPTIAERLYSGFLTSEFIGPFLLLICAVSLCALLARKGPPDGWNWALVGVLAAQLVWWAKWTAGGFLGIIPAIIPVILLAADGLSRLAEMQTNPLKKHATRPPHGPWGQAPAIVVLVALVGVNVITAYGVYGSTAPHQFQPLRPGRQIAAQLLRAAELDDNARIMLVGNTGAFYFPDNTVYATAFDSQPLAQWVRQGLSPEQMLRKLHDMGVTHVWVAWPQVWYLSQTIGFDGELAGGLWTQAEQGQRPGIECLAQLERLGVVVAMEVDRFGSTPATQPTSAPTTQPTSAPVAGPRAFPADWPAITIYAMPWARAVAGPASLPASSPALP